MSNGDDEAEAALTYRDIKIYRPFPQDLPSCLSSQGCNLDDVRIAKLASLARKRGSPLPGCEPVVGAYWLVKGSEDGLYELKTLMVHESYRRRGIGRWLLGHALGIAETRGGRVVAAPNAGEVFFRRTGFADEGCGLRLRLTPE